MRVLLYSLLLTLASPLAIGIAFAQGWQPDPQVSRPGRPYRGLFGTNVGDVDQQLAVNASAGGGFDDNLLADVAQQRGPTLANFGASHRGGLGTGSAGLNYLLSRDRFSAYADAVTTLSYYPTFRTQRYIRRDYADGGVNVNIGKGLFAGGRASYQPYSLVPMFPALLNARGATVVDQDFTFSTVHYASYAAVSGFNHQLTPRTSFSLSSDYQISQASGATQFTSWDAGGQLLHNLTRDLNFRTGYRYVTARYAHFDRRAVSHIIDTGVDYRHALSRSRRTFVSFSTGVSADTDYSEYRTTHFRGIGSAQLTHEIGRTWFTAAAYSRGVDYAEAWPEPIFGDTGSLVLSGLITRRLELSTGVYAMRGNGEFSPSSGSSFHTYYVNAGLSYAFTRFLSAGASYAYYNHWFDDSVLLAAGYPRHLSRQSVRAYVSLWAPLFERTRRRQ
jgi:hypothetical protein